MASPPPPYTPDPPSSADSTIQPAIFSHGTTPMTASSTFTHVDISRSPDSPYMQVASPNLVQNTQYPPPPPGGQRNQSSTRNHAERFLGAINLRSRNNPSVQSAIEPQQHHTIQVFEQTDTLPPAARRAVSASAIGTYTSRSNFSNLAQREMVHTIPPPPPGPPPPPTATSRSQSMNRVSEVTYSPSSITSPRTRLPPGRGPALGPVPPTPANWVDEDIQQSQSGWPSDSRSGGGLLIDTSTISSDNSETLKDTPAHSRKDSFGLVRSPAVRNRSAKGLRERRSESKMGRRQDSGESETSDANTESLSRPLQDIITIDGEALAARRASARITPKSSHFRGLDEALQSSGSQRVSGRFTSGRTTPQSATFSPSSITSPNTSSNPLAQTHHRAINGSTPTSARDRLQMSPQERPVSHILHIPNNEARNIPAIQPESATPKPLHDRDSAFVNLALERHRLFLHKEATASSDSERLNLFIQHAIAESKIRRERYATVFEDEDLDLDGLLEGMFEEPEYDAVDIQLAQLSSVTSTNNSRPSSSSTISHINSQTSRQTSTNTSMDHPTLLIDTSVQEARRGNFIPCLSPIASMSAVTREETESRGRAPSRWWESGSNPSINGDGFKVLERTKKETKYMSAVIENGVSSSPLANVSSSTHHVYSENEYPPEKYIFHEENYTQDHHLLPTVAGRSDTPYTPDPRKLDVSRLITLPPPYPRRHPAVNNSHPDLADIRGIVRVLSDSAEIDAATENYTSHLSEKRTRANSFQQKQQLSHTNAIQRRMDSGTISQQEFDAAEASLESTLATSRLELAKADFSLHESLVVSPLHTIYTTRISRASEALNALSARLLSDTSTHSPNQPQEAGDEQPELLEKLTMLKWLFEARESLHRDLFALLSGRNDRYKVTVLLPLSAAENAEEKASAESFFASDSLDRKKQFTTSTFHRWTSFHSIIEKHVTRGVEIILSAFWDIAPPLQALLQRVPTEARELRKGRFDILIPRSEVEENPTYWDHPLRYLWSIVCHAEASTRQFVEGQVSLWCLLQEVREGLVRAKKTSDLSETQPGAQVENHEQEMADEIRSGVDDLKEKVAAVEGQWVEGLGGEIGRVKGGLKGFLEVTNGWDDEMDGDEVM